MALKPGRAGASFNRCCQSLLGTEGIIIRGWQVRGKESERGKDRTDVLFSPIGLNKGYFMRTVP